MSRLQAMAADPVLTLVLLGCQSLTRNDTRALPRCHAGLSLVGMSTTPKVPIVPAAPAHLFADQTLSLMSMARYNVLDSEHAFDMDEVRAHLPHIQEESLVVVALSQDIAQVPGYEAPPTEPTAIMLLDLDRREWVWNNPANAPESLDLYLQAALMLADAQALPHG